jgi:hypothetical protein
MTPSAQTMWLQFVGALAPYGIDPVQFLPASGLQIADWEDLATGAVAVAGATPGQPNPYAMQQWAGVMPKWAPQYQPSDMDFYQQYCAFLNAIVLTGGDPAQWQTVQQIRQYQVVPAQQQLSKDTAAAMAAWTAYRQAVAPDQQLPYDQWYQQNWAGVIAADQQSLAAAQQNQVAALEAYGGPDYAVYAQALGAASPLAAGTTGVDAGSGMLPQYTISPGAGAWYGGLNAWFQQAMATAGPSVSPQPKPQVQIALELSRPDLANLVNSRYVRAELGAGLAPFGWSGSAKSPRFEVGAGKDYTELLTQCQFAFSAMAFRVFGPIAPGGWYTGQAVGDFYRQTDLTVPLFGPDGVLNLRTGLIAVMYRPRVTLSSSVTTIGQLVGAFRAQAQGGIALGSFYWSAGALENDLLVGGDGTSVTLVDNSNAPKVLGIQPIDLGPGGAG